jgi:signal transduction histidine kinase
MKNMNSSADTDTNSYLSGLSALATRSFVSIQAAVEAILQLMIEQLGMRSSFIAHIKYENGELEVLAAHNMPGGCNIQVGTSVPLPKSFSHMIVNTKRPSSLLVEKLQQSLNSSSQQVPGTFSRIGSSISVPLLLADGTLFGTLTAVDPEPQTVKPQQAEMLAVLARRLVNEIEHDYEQSERKRAQEKLARAMIELRAANRQLQQMNRLKSDFISIVSHEFRTALTGIEGFSEIMHDEDFSDQEIKEFAADINMDAKRLSRMITDMLDLDRMESGQMKLYQEEVNVNETIMAVVERVRPNAPNHSFRFQLDETLPLVVGDSDKLIQVVTNLLTNAVKYSPAGGEILLSSYLEGHMAHVEVQDQGLGIPLDALERVFERYNRVEADSTRYIKGTGLGLPIVREIVEMHGGKVWVESVQGKGSTFHFTLPVVKSGGAIAQ